MKYHRWLVVFEEYDCYGNQGIGTDVVSAPDITGAYAIVNSELRDVLEKNADQIALQRIISITMMPDLQKEV